MLHQLPQPTRLVVLLLLLLPVAGCLLCMPLPIQALVPSRPWASSASGGLLPWVRWRTSIIILLIHIARHVAPCPHAARPSLCPGVTLRTTLPLLPETIVPREHMLWVPSPQLGPVLLPGLHLPKYPLRWRRQRC